MKKLTSGLLAISLAFLVGCSSKVEKVDNSKPIIKVNESVITENMFKEMMDAQINSSFLADKMVNIEEPQNKLVYLIFKDRSINELVIKELINQEIEKRQIELKDSEIQENIDKITAQVGGKTKLDGVLKLNNITMDQFKKSVESDLKIKKLLSTLTPAKVSDGEIKKFYEDNKKTKFTHPAMVRAKHILISASTDEITAKIKNQNPKLGDEEVTQKVQEEITKQKTVAEKILKEVKAKPEDFAKFAKKYSQDPSSAKNGGDLGFFKEKDMVKEFSKTAFAMKPDTISDLVQTDFGFHIIKVTDRKVAGTTPFEELKPEILKYLEDQKKVETLQKLVEGLKNDAKITYLDPEYDPATIQKEIKELAKKQKAPNKKPNAKKVKQEKH